MSKSNKEILIKVLEIGPGELDFYNDRYKIDDISINLTMIDANPISINTRSQKIIIKIFKGLIPTDLSKFKDKSFDLVVCSHVIEHLSKENGYLLMYELDRLTKFVSIISTPNGFSWQTPINSRGKVDWYNAHLSAWIPSELKKCGYTQQFGEVGPKFIFGPGAGPKIRINYLIGFLLGVSYPIFQRFPNSTFAFSAIKRHSQTSNDYLRD